MTTVPLENSLPANLQSTLETGALDEVVTFFAGMTEAQRQAIRPAVVAWRDQLELRIDSLRSPLGYELGAMARNQEAMREAHSLRLAGHGALLACGTLGQFKEVQFFGVPDDTVVAILKDRQPSWIGEYVESLGKTDLSGLAAFAWRRIRAVVRAGLCPAPNNDLYALGAIEGLDPDYYREGQGQPTAKGNAPLLKVELLLRERDWLDTAFWRLFEIDGSTQVSLAGAEKCGRGWIEPLVELSRLGILPRERLLDASLDALSRESG
jgi:hypothetical protein